ncbi:MAG TPA: PEP-CTERM sorting domain-containing protein [Lacipirellulaceae bacterium]|nr:PEP-CTERM sorting domain-containing protein [Lacipirellulaceae bacterium]
MLIGVVDNQGGGDPVSGNTVVAFVATPQTTADFNADGIVDGADLLAWQRGLGRVVGASLADGDGNRDGAVDAADLAIWQGAYAPTVAASAPEPSAGALLGAALIVASWRRRTPATS